MELKKQNISSHAANAATVGNFWYRQRYALAAALLGAAFFILLYGVRVLDPTNVAWILNRGGDPSQHYLGWELYRQSEVHLPYLGMSYATVYPYRTSIIYTDSIPLLAVAFKAVSALLPEPFQYLGIWGLFCFMAQGFFAQKIVWRISGAETRGPWVRWGTVLSALLFLLYPVLTIRMFAHTALAGNWLILMGIWLWLCCPDSLPKACAWWGLMGILCAGVHQYYLPMLGILAVGHAVSRLMRGRGPVLALLPILSYCGCALAELVVLGAFSGNFSDEASSGWNAGADPLNLFVPGLADSWEVDIYIGWGCVLACVLAATVGVIRLLRKRPMLKKSRHLPWFVSSCVIVLLSLLAAASSSITIGGIHVIDLPVPEPIQTLWEMFHVCGRLGWLAGYLLVALACGILLRWGGRFSVAALVVCVLLQGVWESNQLESKYLQYHNEQQYVYSSSLQDDAWDVIAQSGQFEHMAFASYIVDVPEYWSLANYAAQNHWTVNCFYLAHIQYDLMEVTLEGDLSTLSPDTLYVFLERSELNQYYLAGQLHFYRIDGILVGSVEPLPLPEASLQPAKMNLLRCSSRDEEATVIGEDQIIIMPGEMIISDEWKLNPSTYIVTIRGENLDHSYIHSGYETEEEWVEQEIVFLTGNANEISFQMSVGEVTDLWNVQVHALDDTPVIITSIEISVAV